jgi:hypothetical protein
MDRQATLMLALGLLIAASIFVSASGWVLFVRDRRSGRAATVEQTAEDRDSGAEP